MKTELYEPGEQRFRIHRNGRTGIIATVSAVLCATSLLAIPTANAAVPAFPNNLVVFPDRDFITVEGYQTQVGETATVEVNRPGVGIVGSAQSTIAEGEVAFEINHPGGVCWGAGTDLQVTPDIQPGDVVTIKLADGSSEDTRVQDTFVTSGSVLNGNTLTVSGHVGEGVNPDQMEQRIIEPALKDTSVGRRDIRAVPGPMVADDEGAYQSQLVVDKAAKTFTATYVFTDPAVAAIADAATGERSMAWEEQDLDGNRQGLTIAEFGEIGGPGMGGCPNGPEQSGPAGPTKVSADPGDGVMNVSWTPAVAVPGTPAITGYRVAAVSKTASPAGEQVERGVRINNPNASSTQITGLEAGMEYDVYIASVSKVGETFPAVHAIPAEDATAPTVSAAPNGGTFATAQELTLSASEPGSDICYATAEDVDLVSGGTCGPNANVYGDPISVTSDSFYRYTAIDAAGNVSEPGRADFFITNKPAPASPEFTAAPTAGQGSATLSWTGPDAAATGPAITSYSVQAYTSAGPSGEPKKVEGDPAGQAPPTTFTYEGLTADTVYQFTVRATNENGSSGESAKSAPVTVQGAVVANAGPDQSIARSVSAPTVTLDGTGSSAAGKYTWEQVAPTANNKVTLSDPAALKPTFTLPASNDPLTFKLTVTVGTDTKTDEVKVTPVADRITIDRAQWKAGDFRVNGTSSAVGGTIIVTNAAGTELGRATVTAAAAPETGGVWTVRVRTNVVNTNPGQVWAKSSLGGSAGPVAVQNR